jgi:hypothetical protein
VVLMEAGLHVPLQPSLEVDGKLAGADDKQIEAEGIPKFENVGVDAVEVRLFGLGLPGVSEFEKDHPEIPLRIPERLLVDIRVEFG